MRLHSDIFPNKDLSSESFYGAEFSFLVPYPNNSTKYEYDIYVKLKSKRIGKKKKQSIWMPTDQQACQSALYHVQLFSKSVCLCTWEEPRFKFSGEHMER